MSRARDQVRWTDPGSDAEPELASAVRALRARDGGAAQLERLGARLSVQLAEPTTVKVTAAGARSLLRWSALALAAGIALVGVLGYLATRPPTPPPAAARVHVAATAPALPATAPREPAPTVANVTPTPPPAVRARNPHPSAPARRSVDAEGELSLLGRAQSALDRDPIEALALALEHARSYPRGVFAEEREMLALEAELKLHRDAAAHARAERFIARYPRSTHAPRVRTLLDPAR